MLLSGKREVFMAKIFNVNGDCKPNLHYMVNISERLRQIKNMVDEGQYFTINRARQYGKTTTLRALEEFLQKEYTVVRLDFQRMSYADFENENSFVMAFSGEIFNRDVHFFCNIFGGNKPGRNSRYNKNNFAGFYGWG